MADQSLHTEVYQVDKKNGNKKLYVHTSAEDVEVTPTNNVPANATDAAKVFESLSEISFVKNLTARYDAATETLNIGLK